MPPIRGVGGTRAVALLIWSCCAGTSVTRLKPCCVAEPVAGAMAGALLPKSNTKNDGDWVPKRSSSICVCVANMTGKWFFSSMTLQPSLFFNELQSKGKLGVFILIFTFQSTSNVFQSWSERVRKAFLRENRSSSVVSIQLNSSPDSQREFDMNHLYPEGPSEFKFLGSDPEACPFSAFVISSCTMEI